MKEYRSASWNTMLENYETLHCSVFKWFFPSADKVNHLRLRQTTLRLTSIYDRDAACLLLLHIAYCWHNAVNYSSYEGRLRLGLTACAAASCRLHCAWHRRRGVKNEYSKENQTGKRIVVLVVIANDSEELLLVSYLCIILITIGDVINVRRGKYHA